MRITLRLIGLVVSLIVLVVVGFTALQVREEKRQLIENMDRRAIFRTEELTDQLVPGLTHLSKADWARLSSRFTNRPPYIGIAVYDASGAVRAMSQTLNSHADLLSSQVHAVAETGQPQAHHLTFSGRRMHFYISPLPAEKGPAGYAVIVQSMDQIFERLWAIWKVGFFRLLIQSLAISIATLLAIRWAVRDPITRLTEWMRQLRLGETHDMPAKSLPQDFFGPLMTEAERLAQSLTAARAAAEEEAKLRHSAESHWTPERLKEHVRTKLQDRPIFVVANREPYMHVRKGKQIETIMPASGLVTAIEPILNACGGTWVAHGSGDADREVVDAHDRVRVPPEDPKYTLRRLWLSKEEENGYYYGFSNEGLWPLCHIAHTRPLFRVEDWSQYQSVNQRFADTLIQEMEGVSDPIVLVQDYHFALLPRMIKAVRPDARVALFWHIPWPNPESFGICPWQRDILHGMLGADLLGFHVQAHCNHFLDTVDQALESRIDWERFTVNRQGHTTWVKPFPISVAPSESSTDPAALPDKAALFKTLGIKAEFLGVGVDRIDYTKGIVERFRGIERFLEKYGTYRGRFTFVELGAPSRTLIKRYHDLADEVESEVERINNRFKTPDWKPIVFLKKHHSHADIEPYYQAADLCLVTSLHDGMNLVAKEFVSSRHREDGVLILSRFTGAARDMRDALIVNPYDADQTAEAIRFALEMPAEEQQARMHRMRDGIRERNIFWWASRLVAELADIRVSRQNVPPSRPTLSA